MWIAAHPHLCMGMAAVALLVENASPLALFSRKARWVLIPSLFFMQVGNDVLLGINFRQFMLCYAVWVDWLVIGRAVRTCLSRVNLTPRRAAVLFDGSCGLCAHTMAVLRRVDLLQRIEIVDVLADWPEISARYPDLGQDECLRVMYVVDDRGGRTTGFDAYRLLGRIVPLGWALLPLLYVPGVPLVGRKIYQAVADRRFRNGCGVDRPSTLTAAAG